MKGLRVHENKSTQQLKVVNGYFDTICECFPDMGYAKNYKTTINEMAFAWNESFGRGLDVTKLSQFVAVAKPKREYWLGDFQFDDFEAVERYADKLKLKITLIESSPMSRKYNVVLIK